MEIQFRKVPFRCGDKATWIIITSSTPLGHHTKQKSRSTETNLNSRTHIVLPVTSPLRHHTKQKSRSAETVICNSNDHISGRFILTENLSQNVITYKLQKRACRTGEGQALSEPVGDLRIVLASGVNDQEASSSTSPLGPTVFRVGSYSGNLSTESRVDGKKSRRRPQKWKRLRNPEKVCTSGPRP
ncbi:hypothetical protein YC2023_057371 [Brassica napus]